jgi:hypothetical protein
MREMAMRAYSSGRGVRRSINESPYFNWLEALEKEVRKLPSGSNWFEHRHLAPQRCRRFLMARFPKLVRAFPDTVLSSEFSRGIKRIRRSDHGSRILRDLSPAQAIQLAGLVLDLIEATETYASHGRTRKTVGELAAEADSRSRMLSRKTLKIRRELQGLIKYARRLNPALQAGYPRAAERCLEILEKLKPDHSAGEFYRLQRPEYPALEDPRQLGMVQLYWFFRHECRCSGRESEVRVAMTMNEFLPSHRRKKLRYNAKYTDAETQGCSAVRLAVSRYHPRTID